MAKRMKKFEKESKGFHNYFITDSGRDISEIKRTITTSSWQKIKEQVKGAYEHSFTKRII